MTTASITTPVQIGHVLAVVVALGVCWRSLARRRPDGWGWPSIALGLTITGSSHVYQVISGLGLAATASAFEALYAAGYLAVSVGLVIMVVRRSTRSSAGAALILDALIASGASALIVWVALIQPRIERSDALPAGVAAGYIVGDVIIATVVIRLSTASGGNRSARWLGAAVAAVWVGDVVFIWKSEESALGNTCYVLVYVAAAVAASRCDMAELSAPARTNHREVAPRPGTLVLALAALVLALALSYATGGPAPGVAVGLAVLTGVAGAARIQLVVREHESFSRRLYDLAETDALTGLPNRRALERHLAQVVEAPDLPAAVLFIDLDRFKAVNDNHGHAVGDELLKATARRLRSAVRSRDHVARLAGDEFVVVCQGLGPGETGRDVAARVEAALAQPLATGDLELAVSASVGVAPIEPGCDVRGLLRQADEIMYARKRTAPPAPSLTSG